jgi:hypothetical protein
MFDKLKSKLQPQPRGTAKREIPDDELKKYTGMDKSQLSEWSKDRPDVAGNQLAGKINMGTSGGGGIPNSFSYTGRGDSAADELKFPPSQTQKKKEDEKVEKDVDGDSE